MSFLTELATHIKDWANGKFQSVLPTPVGNAGKALVSDGTTFILSTVGGSSTETFSPVLSSLSIALSSYGYYKVEISANATFVLSNITTGRYYTIRVKNVGASTITVSLPSGGAYTSGTADITAGKAREFSVVSDGTQLIWQNSDEMINA